MQDEQGNLPFAIVPDHDGHGRFRPAQPGLLQKSRPQDAFLAEQGFVPVFEPVRRDTGPSWKAYFDFNKSYARYVAYLAARYGAFNLIFSGIHLDWIPKDVRSLRATNITRP